MKTKAIVSILILTLVVLIVAGSCATKRKAISDEDFFKAWSGTWINTEFKGGSDSQKMINHPDGTEESFGMLTSTTPSRSYKYTILEKWLDSKGTIWYRGQWESYPPFSSKGYVMGKISDSGNTMEYIYAGEDFPIEEWEPDKFEYNYRIRYRQE